MASPLASLCARRAGDVAPYHSNMVGIMWHLVFPSIPGRGRRPRRPASRWRLRWRPRVRGAPWTSRPTIITWLASCGTLCSRVSLITWLASCGTLCSSASLVGADVPGGPRPDGVSAGVPVCAARRDVAPYHNNMFAIIWHLVFPCIPGRGRRPRRPASPLASPLAFPCARRAVDVAPYHNNMVGIMWHLVFPRTRIRVFNGDHA